MRSDWIRPEIRALKAYHVADARGLIKLDAMENPFTWPEDLRQQWAAGLAHTDVNRYPHPHAPEVVARLRQTMGIAADMPVMLGNGSDEIIQIIAMALASPGRSLLSVQPAFVMYHMIAEFCALNYVGVRLKPDFSLDLPAMLKAIEQHQPAVIFLAYPNNPTGNLFDEADIISIIQAAPGLVVVDEAYAPFADGSFMPRLGQFPNLVVMRTLSKMGLAGLRLGYLAGPAQWLDEFDKLRLPYNINNLTQYTTCFALDHIELFDAQTQEIRAQRAILAAGLSAIPGLQAYPSQANFILVRTPSGQARPIFDRLKQAGILIKILHGSHPLLEDCLRITVGTAEENQALLKALAAD